jgi:3-oxoacyl-ACP reductase-like protein
MVNYGADEIFKVGSTDVQDEDIELLIKRGLDKAESMQKKAENIVKDKFNMLDFQMNSVNMYQFEGQHIIITGGTRGIGAGLTESFLKAGATVVATYSGNDEAAKNFKEKNKKFGKKAFFDSAEF